MDLPRLDAARRAGSSVCGAALPVDAAARHEVRRVLWDRRIVTSYEPNATAISHEPKDSDERYKFDT